MAMPRQYTVSLTAGERVDATFALRSKEMRSSRTGEAYLSLEFADRSGRISGIMFRPGREAESVPVGTVVAVRGTVTAYRGVLRVSVSSMKPASRYEPREILPASPRDADEMISELRDHVRAIANPGLAGLVKAVYGDRRFMRAFRVCPASRSEHHAYIGGLLEHTVAVAGLCRTMADLHPQIDGDLLLTGALLHDIGIVDELEFQTAIEYTDRGRLSGHAVLGDRRLFAAAAALGSPLTPDVLDHVSHMVLSHHSADEQGGRLRPRTLEAAALAQVDSLDARTAGFIAEGRVAGMVGERWTSGGIQAVSPPPDESSIQTTSPAPAAELGRRSA
ncbi:MAG TPA: HD domain-containing protein [Actinobacteria bacterium]|nr:HD domain-containing protein [Actinomycetota bacterium]